MTIASETPALDTADTEPCPAAEDLSDIDVSWGIGGKGLSDAGKQEIWDYINELRKHEDVPTARDDDSDDQPEMQCPQCKAWLPDFDGFGVLAHTKPAYADGCGYCAHPALADGVCEICGVRP